MPLMHEPSSSPTLNNRSSSPLRLSQSVKIKNRRKLYLDRHPEYFTNPDLELLDPLLYDRCIRRFQTASEREADGKARGYSRVLEADLYRSEAKLAALQKAIPSHDALSQLPSSLISTTSSSHQTLPSSASTDTQTIASQIKTTSQSLETSSEEEVINTKDEGLERWKFEMTQLFLKGEDPDFEYEAVDESREWDDEVEARDQEERWFDDESPDWRGGSEDDGDGEGKEKGRGGETGIQDF